PLGPFIPVPSEVAMRMMRDQRGPSLFEGGIMCLKRNRVLKMLVAEGKGKGDDGKGVDFFDTAKKKGILSLVLAGGRLKLGKKWKSAKEEAVGFAEEQKSSQMSGLLIEALQKSMNEDTKLLSGANCNNVRCLVPLSTEDDKTTYSHGCVMMNLLTKHLQGLTPSA
nr:serrate RNA effector molecule [Tanacetum cinerariifolium]